MEAVATAETGACVAGMSGSHGSHPSGTDKGLSITHIAPGQWMLARLIDAPMFGLSAITSNGEQAGCATVWGTCSPRLLARQAAPLCWPCSRCRGLYHRPACLRTTG